MTHTAKVLGNLADILAGSIARSSMPKIVTHQQKMEMQNGDVQ